MNIAVRFLFALAVSIPCSGCFDKGQSAFFEFQHGDEVMLDSGSIDVLIMDSCPVKGEPFPESKLVSSGMEGRFLGAGGDRNFYARFKPKGGDAGWVVREYLKPIPVAH